MFVVELVWVLNTAAVPSTQSRGASAPLVPKAPDGRLWDTGEHHQLQCHDQRH